MDEIKVVPYIPDEDYDNPAMVVDFYEFTMANCLFLHGFKDTTLVFDMFFRKNPDNMGYSISAGQRKPTRFLLQRAGYPLAAHQGYERGILRVSAHLQVEGRYVRSARGYGLLPPCADGPH